MARRRGAAAACRSAPDWRGPCSTVAFAAKRWPAPSLRQRDGAAQPQPAGGQAQEAAARPATATSAEPQPGRQRGRRDLGLGATAECGTASRAGARWATEGGLTYGVGLSWDFSRSGSASVGWDSYDLRSAAGEARDVRATSLGLQWRY